MSHPLVCYVKIESQDEIAVVKWGKSGYYKLDKQPNETIDTLNDEIGVSAKEAKAMLMLSFNNSIADNDKAWEEKFSELMAKLQEG